MKSGKGITVHDPDTTDQLAIRRLLHRYARAVDTRDWELYRSLFTADAHLDYSSAPLGHAGPRDEIVGWLSHNLAFLPMTMHYITNVEADVDGDTAEVHAQFYNPMQFPGFDEMSYCGGYYHHDLIRTHVGWQSRSLTEENIWFVNPPVSPSAGASAGS